MSTLPSSAKRLQWLCSELRAGNQFSNDLLWRWEKEAEAEMRAKTRADIMAALAGDPVAVAQNYNIVKQLERREREEF